MRLFADVGRTALDRQPAPDTIGRAQVGVLNGEVVGPDMKHRGSGDPTATGHRRAPLAAAEGVARRGEHLRTVLSELLRISLADLAFEEQLRQILLHVVSVPGLAVESKGAIFLVEDDPAVLVMKAHHNLSPALLALCARVPFGRCLCGRAAASGQIEFADRVDERHETRYRGMLAHGHYCVPIMLRGRLLGVLNLYVKEGYRADPRDEEFLHTVADVLAGIVEHRRMEEKLKETLAKLREAFDATIQALALTVERRDPYTAGHQRRVADLARAIADEMALAREQVDAICLAAVIHDIGKISVPAEILSKPGRLSPVEFELIKMHPRVGYDILSKIEFPGPVAEVVLQHHERMGGSGYPRSLAGDEILLEARSLAVADVVEAMVSHRPYRPMLNIEKALEEISRNRGTLYDPLVVDACLRLFKEKGFTFEQGPARGATDSPRGSWPAPA